MIGFRARFAKHGVPILSQVVNSGSYEQKAAIGNTKKVFTIWLYYIPDLPIPNRSSPPPPSKPIKKVKKEQIKAEKNIKVENIKSEKGIKSEKRIKSEPSALSKRPRAVSAEMPIPKRPGTVTRMRARELESKELRNSFAGDSDVEDPDAEDSDERPRLEELEKEVKGSENEDLAVD